MSLRANLEQTPNNLEFAETYISMVWHRGSLVYCCIARVNLNLLFCCREGISFQSSLGANSKLSSGEMCF